MVNFLAREYRDDGEKTWHLGCLECLECPGRLECPGTFGMYHTFGIRAIRHMREIERFRKCLTKSYRFDIIIVQRETIIFFNSKRWTRGALYIIMYTRGA